MENRRKNHATLHRALRSSHALTLWPLSFHSLTPGMYTIISLRDTHFIYIAATRVYRRRC